MILMGPFQLIIFYDSRSSKFIDIWEEEQEHEGSLKSSTTGITIPAQDGNCEA